MTSDAYVLVMNQPPPPVMDLLQYAEKQKSHKIRNKKARSIMRQVINIMMAVHAAGVFHQDLKHENLLIEPLSGTIHLIDFGLAVLVSEEPYKKLNGKPINLLFGRQSSIIVVH